MLRPLFPLPGRHRIDVPTVKGTPWCCQGNPKFQRSQWVCEKKATIWGANDSRWTTLIAKCYARSFGASRIVLITGGLMDLTKMHGAFEKCVPICSNGLLMGELLRCITYLDRLIHRLWFPDTGKQSELWSKHLEPSGSIIFEWGLEDVRIVADHNEIFVTVSSQWCVEFFQLRCPAARI